MLEFKASVLILCVNNKWEIEWARVILTFHNENISARFQGLVSWSFFHYFWFRRVTGIKAWSMTIISTLRSSSTDNYLNSTLFSEWNFLCPAWFLFLFLHSYLFFFFCGTVGWLCTCVGHVCIGSGNCRFCAFQLLLIMVVSCQDGVLRATVHCVLFFVFLILRKRRFRSCWVF